MFSGAAAFLMNVDEELYMVTQNCHSVCRINNYIQFHAENARKVTALKYRDHVYHYT